VGFFKVNISANQEQSHFDRGELMQSRLSSNLPFSCQNTGQLASDAEPGGHPDFDLSPLAGDTILEKYFPPKGRSHGAANGLAEPDRITKILGIESHRFRFHLKNGETGVQSAPVFRPPETGFMVVLTEMSCAFTSWENGIDLFAPPLAQFSADFGLLGKELICRVVLPGQASELSYTVDITFGVVFFD
jgi:hypothetical protein